MKIKNYADLFPLTGIGGTNAPRKRSFSLTNQCRQEKPL